MKDDRKRKPEKTAGYKKLVDQFGIEAVADRLLAKWISDTDAGDKWEHLYAVVAIAADDDLPTPPHKRPYKYWVILWYYSMGYEREQIAEQLGIKLESVKGEMRYVRARLDLVGAPLTQVVAKAIRLGKIP